MKINSNYCKEFKSHTELQIHINTHKHTNLHTLHTHTDTHTHTLWKSSNCTPATAPLTREAIALQASPTKSGTENNFAASLASLGSTTSKCLRITDIP